MEHEPRLHLEAIVVIGLLLALGARRRAVVNHPLDGAADEREEDKVRGSQHGAVRVPRAHVRRLQRLVRLEPASGEGAGDGGGE